MGFYQSNLPFHVYQLTSIHSPLKRYQMFWSINRNELRIMTIDREAELLTKQIYREEDFSELIIAGGVRR